MLLVSCSLKSCTHFCTPSAGPAHAWQLPTAPPAGSAAPQTLHSSACLFMIHLQNFSSPSQKSFSVKICGTSSSFRGPPQLRRSHRYHGLKNKPDILIISKTLVRLYSHLAGVAKSRGHGRVVRGRRQRSGVHVADGGAHAHPQLVVLEDLVGPAGLAGG